jgi:hypothetical protein
VPYVPNELLIRLVGLRLLAVEFILDYAVIKFDGEPTDPQPSLSFDVMPHVEMAPGTLLRDGEPGYLEALRALVGHDVLATVEQQGEGFRIDLTAGSIVVDPDAEELAGPEIATLSGFADDAWMCWRPGEDTFAHLS